MSWESGELGDFLTLKRGHDLPNGSRKAGDIPVVSSSGFTGLHNEAKAEPPGVVTGRYGTIGEVFYVDQPYWPLNTALYVIDFKGNDPRFISYFLRSHLKNYKSEKAAVPGVDRKVLHKLPAKCPDTQIQQSIVRILSAYDDLIENNRRRIGLLEDAARQLYKEWFVRFRFPGHEHVKFVDGVPEGWERKTIAELSSFLSRGITPTYDDEAPGLIINQKCIRDSKVSLEPARPQRKVVPENKLVRKFDILVNSTGAGTLGRVAQNFHEFENLTVDSHVTIVRPRDDVAPVWLGLSLTSKQDFIATLGRGATNQTELSKDDIGAIPIIVSSDILLWQFEEEAAKTAELIFVLAAQNHQLAKARDLLLPRLMNGSLTV